MEAWARVAIRLTIVVVCSVSSLVQAAAEWQVIKVGRWDYLTADNIAKFYGFGGDVQPIGNTIQLDNGKNQLEITLDSREAIVNGVRNWLCFPVIRHSDGKFLVSRIDLAKTIEPQFRPQMIRNFGRIKTVVIDPGHGGPEKGAGSSYGNEKDFTLDVALKLRPLLQAKGYNVVMTRDRDMLVPLHERARIANATRDSVLISIHFNATDANPAATGFEIYSLTPRGAPSTQDNHLLEHFLNMQAGSPVDAPSLVLSTSVYHAMLGHMPEFDRGVKRARFAVLRLTNIPAILVEGGFVTERAESRLIARPEWRGKLAQAISVGIDNYRGLVERRERPMLLADYRRRFEGVLVARNATPPVADASAAAIPASNQLAPAAQITTALRHEPSAQIAVSDELATSASPVSPPPPQEIADAIEQEVMESESASVAPVIGQETVRVADGSDVAMPDSSALDPAKNSAVPSASPAVPVRKYWILKFAPPPKFRE
ncbi:MAG: N-acetylmuramoyl-L-alanine amidase [Verrucomicrobiota bacterium]|nr:N-acetylmuramoyl-L-alanine amidase [Verrucomicrobiota bacterium]